MKKVTKFLYLFVLLGPFSSCIKNEDVVFDSNALVEWDAATYTARSGGFPFPLLTRVPIEHGRQQVASVSGVTVDLPASRQLRANYMLVYGANRRFPGNFMDTVITRVNLVGAQRDRAQTFGVRVEPNFSTAVAGVHYDLLDNSVTIPANSSFGFVRFVIRDAGAVPAGSPNAVNLVLELFGNNDVAVSGNYRYVGWTIAQ